MSSGDWAPTVRAVLKAIAIVCRVAAWALVALVLADCVVTGSSRTELLSVNSFVSGLIPDFISGLFVFSTPFGGAFRGDFALAAIILLVIDWICCRVSASLR